MQSEKSVEIEYRAPWNIDGWPHRIVRTFLMRHHDVKAVGRSALEYDHEPLVARTHRLGAVSGARKKCRNGSGADDSEPAIPQEYSPCNRHENAPDSQLAALVFLRNQTLGAIFSETRAIPTATLRLRRHSVAALDRPVYAC